MEASGSLGAGQGAPAAGAQPGSVANNSTQPGQGGAAGQPTPQAGGQQQQGAFNWGNFPDVPEAQRELLEPHLRNIQGHVTRMEMQSAPYRGLMEAVPNDQVENLVGFINAYSNNPLGTVLGLLQQERDAGNITHEQLMEFVGATPAVQGQQQPAQGQQLPTDQMPDWARQMQSRLDQYDQQAQQQAEAAQEAELQTVYENAVGNIRAQLTQSGIPDTVVTDQVIQAAIIASDGDEQAAVNMLTAMRDGFLGAFTNGRTANGQAPAVNGQLPQVPKPSKGRDDGFRDARVGARQYLEQQMGMAARG